MNHETMMKNILLTASLLIGTISGLYAQYAPEAVIKSCPVSVGWDNTTVLVFPFEVRSVDRGNPVIMVQKDAFAGNVLKLRAGAMEFDPASLHVITSGGRLYHFKVSYKENPWPLVLDVGRQEGTGPYSVVLEGSGMNGRELKQTAAALLEYPSAARIGAKSKSGKVRAVVRGILTMQGTLFFVLDLANNSAMDFKPSIIRSWELDRKQVKRTTQRRVEKEAPFIQWKGAEGIKAGGTNRLVLAFPNFTIADHKTFKIDLKEKVGDRHLSILLKGRHLLNAQPIIKP